MFPSSRLLHDFHTSLSLLLFAIYNTNTLLHCTVALRKLRKLKLYLNDVTKFGQLLQNCKLFTIHRNTTTGNYITAGSKALLQPSTATAAHRIHADCKILSRIKYSR